MLIEESALEQQVFGQLFDTFNDNDVTEYT